MAAPGEGHPTLPFTDREHTRQHRKRGERSGAAPFSAVLPQLVEPIVRSGTMADGTSRCHARAAAVQLPAGVAWVRFLLPRHGRDAGSTLPADPWRRSSRTKQRSRCSSGSVSPTRDWWVVVGGDATAGFRLALAEPFDVAVLDVMLPDLDATAVLRRLGASAMDVPVNVLTARGDVADRIARLELGADDDLVEPFAFEELLVRIRTVLRRRGAEDAPRRPKTRRPDDDDAPHDARVAAQLGHGGGRFPPAVREPEPPSGRLRRSSRSLVLGSLSGCSWPRSRISYDGQGRHPARAWHRPRSGRGLPAGSGAMSLGGGAHRRDPFGDGGAWSLADGVTRVSISMAREWAEGAGPTQTQPSAAGCRTCLAR